MIWFENVIKFSKKVTEELEVKIEFRREIKTFATKFGFSFMPSLVC